MSRAESDYASGSAFKEFGPTVETAKAKDFPALPALVIGIGNDYRHDDGVGLAIARSLQPLPSSVCVMEHSGDGTGLLDAWSGAERVILIDAVSSGSTAGTIHRLDATARPIPPAWFHCSSHAFGVAEGIALARTLNRLPPRLILYGIEGADFSMGSGLSPELARAVEEVTRRVKNEIKQTPES